MTFQPANFDDLFFHLINIVALTSKLKNKSFLVKIVVLNIANLANSGQLTRDRLSALTPEWKFNPFQKLFQSELTHAFCSDIRYESNGIFVLRQIQTNFDFFYIRAELFYISRKVLLS